MAAFRLVGNSPAVAFLAGRLVEEGHAVEWWTCGYFPSLRSLKLRSESLHDLILYFRRSKSDLQFLLRSPSIKSWASLRDGGAVVHLVSEIDEGFEDHFVDGAALYLKLKDAALARGVKIRDFSASFMSPLVALPKETLLVTDVPLTEMRLWPLPAPKQPVMDEHFYHTQSVWFPRLGQRMTAEINAILFAQWKGTELLLEPSAERGMVLSLASSSPYFLLKAMSDALNPKVTGLSELRALFLLNGRRLGSEQTKVRIGVNGQSLPMAMHLGSSVGTFHPLLNVMDDFSIREAENMIAHCRTTPHFDEVAALNLIDSWNLETRRRFLGEHRLGLFWKRLLFSRSWGRYMLRASRYLPKTVRERLQSPA